MKRNQRIGERREEVYTVTVYTDVRTGVVVSETWEMDGKQHREGAPSSIERDADTGIITNERWMKNGKTDRADGPAVIARTPAGRVFYSAWFQNDERIAPPKRPRGPRVTTSLREGGTLARGPAA
jgi:hypothetical protein